MEKNNYVEIDGEGIRFNFKDSFFKVVIHRTLRLPDDNNKYSLPPSLGAFKLDHVEDYEKVPESWKEHGGAFFPMYQSEACWLGFNSSGRPFAIKVAAGKINAVSGKIWTNQLVAGRDGEQDYMISPNQPWLDGFNVAKGVIRQFIATPLGKGYSAEEQLTKEAKWGGIQIIVYPMKDEYWEKIKPKNSGRAFNSLKIKSLIGTSSLTACSVEMGLGAGGYMNQEIYEDNYGLDAWDHENYLRVFIHIANSEEYYAITGKKPHAKPLGPSEYKNYNYPWFEYYSDSKALDGSKELASLDSVASLQVKKDEVIIADNSSVEIKNKININFKKSLEDKSW